MKTAPADRYVVGYACPVCGARSKEIAILRNGVTIGWLLRVEESRLAAIVCSECGAPVPPIRWRFERPDGARDERGPFRQPATEVTKNQL